MLSDRTNKNLKTNATNKTNDPGQTTSHADLTSLYNNQGRQGAGERVASALPPSHLPAPPPALSFALAGGFVDKRAGRDTIMNTDVCDVTITDLSAFLDGELDADQGRAIAAHMAQCSRCATIFESMQQTDDIVEREWRESAPLPSSLRFEQSVDSILAALPPVSVEAAAFATKRVHSRTRWMRFATGMTCSVLLSLSLYSSYQLGYVNGRRSLAPVSSASDTLHSMRSPGMRSPEFTASLLPASLRLDPEQQPPSVSAVTPPLRHTTAQP